MTNPFIVEHKTLQDDNGFYCDMPLVVKDKAPLVKNWVRVVTKSMSTPFSVINPTHQEDPFEENKYLKVLSGEIYCMVICVDKLRPNYLVSEILHVDSDHAIYIPKGYAVGYITTKPDTVTQSFIDNSYSEKHEVTIPYQTIEQFNVMVEGFKNQ